MSNDRPVEDEIAEALAKVSGYLFEVEPTHWREKADEFILALAGRAVFVSKEDHDETTKQKSRLQALLAASRACYLAVNPVQQSKALRELEAAVWMFPGVVMGK